MDIYKTLIYFNFYYLFKTFFNSNLILIDKLNEIFFFFIKIHLLNLFFYLIYFFKTYIQSFTLYFISIFILNKVCLFLI